MKKVIILVIIGMLIILSLFFIIVFMQNGFSSITSETIGNNEDSFEDAEPILSLSSQCNTNVYDCYHFVSQSEAQKVFEECGDLSNDVHYLDRDGDGIACEILLKYN